jgi:hypothetical protein
MRGIARRLDRDSGAIEACDKHALALQRVEDGTDMRGETGVDGGQMRIPIGRAAL